MAEASAWLARLHRDDLSASDAAAFDAWLAAAPANGVAYRQAAAVMHEFSCAADDVLAELESLSWNASRPAAPSRRWMLGAGGFAIAAGLAIAVLPSSLLQPRIDTYVTRKGERRRVTLADGSTVDLNAQSQLSVSFSGARRHVALGEGEAIFDVAHDEQRPFMVEASNHLVQVVGTQFDVRSRRGGLVVTVARGKVQVRPIDSAAGGRASMLTPGERLEIASGGAESISAVDPQETFSWRAGRLVYRAEPLADVVAELNRQFVEQIEIADPALADMPITGVIVLDDPRAVVTRLGLMLPIRSVPSDRGLLLLRK